MQNKQPHSIFRMSFKKFSILTILILIMTGCVSNQEIEPLAENTPQSLLTLSATVKPILTNTVPANLSTATEIISTSPPSPTFSPLIEQKGDLLYLFHDGYITLLNLTTTEQKRINYPIFCESGLIPNTNLIKCIDEGKIFFYEPVMKERVDVSLSNDTQILRISPEGQHFLVVEKINGKNKFSIFHDLTAESNWKPLDLLEEANLSIPVVSHDGNYLAYQSVANPSRITVLNIQNGDEQEFYINQSEIVTLISWSPTNLFFIAGANENQTDYPGILDSLYLIDLENNNRQLLAITDFENPYEYIDFVTNSNIWSPNGEDIIIPTPRGFCRITISTRYQQCIKMNDIEHVISFEWSPKSDEFATVFTIKDSNDKVFVFSNRDLTIKREIHFSAIKIEQVNWR